jgi:hypothetical protein
MASDIPVNYYGYPTETPRGPNWLSQLKDRLTFLDITDGDDFDTIPDDAVTPDGDGMGI